jgi:hypothetical protein
VGGMLKTGTMPAAPISVAFCPEIQHVWPLPSGSEITQ